MAVAQEKGEIGEKRDAIWAKYGSAKETTAEIPMRKVNERK